MKQWVKKLVEQFEIDETKSSSPSNKPTTDLNEERATLLYMIDVLNKHLFDIEGHTQRKTREHLDDFSKALLQHDKNSEDVLFRIRQFYSAYRISEHTYLQKTFEDFKNIIWEFADHLGDDLKFEQAREAQLKTKLDSLREAVEANSIESLKKQSREFINSYVDLQNKKVERRSKQVQSMKKNLDTVKKQLTEANEEARLDHLTKAHNRRSFDEQTKRLIKLYDLSGQQMTLLSLDIDHFKKINDCYGHDIGDFILKEFVRIIKTVFHRDVDFVARVGGEEFAVILPDYSTEAATQKAEQLMSVIRKEVFVQEKMEIRFTVSIGVAQRAPQEGMDSWLKRADQALYQSKNTGRNKLTVAPSLFEIVKAS